MINQGVDATLKDYQCPTCRIKSRHNTNHYGEIYYKCKGCGNDVLYPMGVNFFQGRKFIEAKFLFYDFDLTIEEQRRQYWIMYEDLEGLGYQRFTYTDYSPAGSLHLFRINAFKQYDKKIIKLYDIEKWKNQFVSNIGRVFQWKEAVLPNENIKIGYYLIMKGKL